MEAGDYVFATKYSDGDPGDGWAIGFFDGMLPKVTGDRYMVIDNNGKQFRGNGFRRAEVIPRDIGESLIKAMRAFDPPNMPTPGAVNAWDIVDRLKSESASQHLCDDDENSDHQDDSYGLSQTP